MNVFDPKQIHVFDPEELEEDHFSKMTYAKEPFIFRPGIECSFHDGNLYLQDSLVSWFEKVYQESMVLFHEVSKDWFEDPLTLQEVQSSFLSPIKRVKDGFVLVCHVEEERDGIPVFHIKGIQFNSKHFFLRIEVEFAEIDSDDLSEFMVDTDSLPTADLHLDKLSIYKVYEFLNQKIKDSMVEEIRGILSAKKIKTRIDFLEVFDDEEPDE